MSLVIKNSVSEKSDASLLRLYDKTGIFSADRPSSWQDATTAFIADVTVATQTIYLTNTTTLLASTTNPVVIDVFPTLPNIINTPYEATATALGYIDGVIPDGMITVVYDVTVVSGGITTVYSSSVKQILYANLCCCVKELQSRVDACGCDCEDSTVQAALYAWTLLKGLQRAVSCNKTSKALEMLKSLQQICNSNNCTSCH